MTSVLICTGCGDAHLESQGLGVEAEGSGVQGYPQLHSKLEASLGYMRTCLKKRTHETNNATGRGLKAKPARQEGSVFDVSLRGGDWPAEVAWRKGVPMARRGEKQSRTAVH